MKTLRSTIPATLSFLLLALPLHAQDPNALNGGAPKPPSAPKTGGSSGGGSTPAANPTDLTGSSFLGKDVPLINPSNNLVTWDGHNWVITDNQLFRARFVKYLNAPEETAAEDIEYNEIIREILDLLSPGNAQKTGANGRPNTETAFNLLSEASDYNIDAQLCDAIANSVYSVWLARKDATRIHRVNQDLERRENQLNWNLTVTTRESGLGYSATKDPIRAKEESDNRKLVRETRMAPYTERLAATKAQRAANAAKIEASEILIKLQFQSLMVQYFLQRRFQHVLIASRFYRALFSDGDVSIKVGSDAQEAFSKLSGGPPTLDVLDSLASEAMRDVGEGIEAYNYLVEKNEMASATERLMETFILGEYMPEVRALPREKKRLALKYSQKSLELISALEVRDFARAENLVAEIKETAQDFDDSKPIAAIETAKSTSAMHITKAITAASKSDAAGVEEELKQAAMIWPRNPKLAEVTAQIMGQANQFNKALVDFDELLRQRNYWEIDKDKARFLVAVSQAPEKQAQLEEVLKIVGEIQIALLQAEEISRRGDSAGAWESIETVFQKYPDDIKLNQLRTSLTVKASDFVQSLQKAKDLEEKEQIGSSLAWYLKAQQVYPQSDFARQGIERLVPGIIKTQSEQYTPAGSEEM